MTQTYKYDLYNRIQRLARALYVGMDVNKIYYGKDSKDHFYFVQSGLGKEKSLYICENAPNEEELKSFKSNDPKEKESCVNLSSLSYSLDIDPELLELFLEDFETLHFQSVEDRKKKQASLSGLLEKSDSLARRYLIGVK